MHRDKSLQKSNKTAILAAFSAILQQILSDDHTHFTLDLAYRKLASTRTNRKFQYDVKLKVLSVVITTHNHEYFLDHNS